VLKRYVKQGDEVLYRCPRRIPDRCDDRTDVKEEPCLPLAHRRQIGFLSPVDRHREFMLLVL
jgi:hypothetical protein